MKWFRHDTNMHTNLKLQGFLDRWKMIGYGVWNLCLEVVGGVVDAKNPKFVVKKTKNWQKYLKKISGISDTTLNKILEDLAEANLINKKQLQKGHLAIPKMKDKMDEYTESVVKGWRPSSYRISTKELNNTTDNNTIHNNTKENSKYSSLSKKKLKRYYKPTNEEMRFSANKWWVISKSGEWLEFAGEDKDTEFK